MPESITHLRTVYDEDKVTFELCFAPKYRFGTVIGDGKVRQARLRVTRV